MKTPSSLIVQPPPLADETAREMLAFLSQLIAALETHYAKQPPLHPEPTALPHQPDLFDDPGDGKPPS